MSEHVRRLLLYGISAARTERYDQARRYLIRASEATDATHAQKADAFVWLAKISDDPKTKRDYLESVIAFEPLNAEARRELAILDGRLKREDMVDPDNVAVKENNTPEATQARRFICTQCGAPIPFAAGKAMLECRYCGHQQSLLESYKNPYSVRENDFVVALATAKGHSVPENVVTYKCSGCQATMLTTGQLSDHCPYCGSPHVIKTDTKEQIIPDGILPFTVSQEQADRHFKNWLRERFKKHHLRTTKMRGVYVPVWVFDITGQLDWRIIQQQNQFNFTRPRRSIFHELQNPDQMLNNGLQRSSESRREPDGSHMFFADGIMVGATHKLPYKLQDIFGTFNTGKVQDFNPAVLSGWIAEQYEITVSDASLIARQKAIKTEWRQVESMARMRSNDNSEIRIIPVSMAVDTFRLWLIPLWFGNFRIDDDPTTYTVIVNGENGAIKGERPKSAIGKWLDELF